MKPIQLRRNKQGQLEAEIDAISSWDGFDEIAKFLVGEFAAVIEKRVDGPDARLWTMKVGSQVLSLRHDDDFGNSIVAEGEDAEALLVGISEAIVNRIKSQE